MTKLWKDRETLINDAINGQLSNNPERYVISKVCVCDRWVPQSYSRKFQQREGVEQERYEELERLIAQQEGEFTVDGLARQFIFNNMAINPRWIDTNRIRRLLQVMNCEGKVTCQWVKIPHPNRPKEELMVQLFGYNDNQPVGLCPFRIGGKCTFQFRQNGKKIDKADLPLA